MDDGEGHRGWKRHCGEFVLTSDFSVIIQDSRLNLVYLSRTPRSMVKYSKKSVESSGIENNNRAMEK
ncbi:hypothetical protein PV325_013753 [Microctonus aethiopoides]|nr:hypothetical protein PV325_013753 [Microctonus aethiopoides]